MGKPLRITRRDLSGQILLTFEGSLDEDSRLEPFLEDISGEIRVDLRGITAINSCGMREWVKAVRLLEWTCRIEYADIPVIMIQQFNTILNSRGKGRVLSFFAPYYCDPCDKPVEIRIDLSLDHPSLARPDALSAPQSECETCGRPLEFDELPEKYFYFLELQLREEGSDG